MSDFIEITREMGINHADFLRLLPKSLPGAMVNSSGDEKNGAHIAIENAPYGRMEIDLSSVGERKIALLVLPVTFVTFRFFGVDETTANAEYERMAKTFQRGGG